MSFGAKHFQSWCVLAVAGCVGAASAQVTVIDDFESGDLSNWTTRCGSWEIVSPGNGSSFAVRSTQCCTGACGDKRLDHNSFNGGFGRYTYDVFFEGSFVEDGDLYIQVVNDCRYLGISMHPAGSDNTFDFVQVVDSGTTTIGCTPIQLAPNSWHTVQVERYPNGVIRVFTDGNMVMETIDTSLSSSGGIALRAHYCGVRYDNITFNPSLPPNPALPSPPSCIQIGWPSCDSFLCSCGNGLCQSGETRCNCPSDCSATFCGDGCCGGGENAGNCPADCGGGPVCGNFACESGENRCNCPSDCGATFCGDGCCGGGENAGNCPADCGGGPVCGNFACESGENRCNCPSDCGATFCGDGLCCAGERCTCSFDCGVSYCGDGVCCANTGEDHSTCPGDCPAGACCLSNNGCVLNETQDGCVKLGGRYMGDGTTVCLHNDAGNCIPTLSEWGLLAMTLLVLTAGTVVVMRRRAMVHGGS